MNPFERIDEILEKKSVDGFLVTYPENILWTTGFIESEPREMFGFYVQTPQEKLLVIDGRYVEKARKITKKTDIKVILYIPNFREEIGKKYAGTWGYESSMSFDRKKFLKHCFPSVHWKKSTGLIEALRRQKNTSEINAITTAQHHVDIRLIDFLKDTLHTGITERSLQFKLHQALQDNGKFGLSFMAITAFGENSAVPHHAPGDRKLKLGDNVLVDCGVRYQGWCSDLTRNFLWGSGPKGYKTAYKTLLDAHQKTLPRIRAGASSKKIDAFCRKCLGSEAPFFTHSLGHGVGLEIHELPTLSASKNYTLQTNEVVTCEPGLYYPNRFGIRIEDLLMVTHKSPQILSQISKDLLSFDENGNVQKIILAE